MEVSQVRMPATSIRNIALIAHVDHGKTTLVDAMLRQTKIPTPVSGNSKLSREKLR
jgi:predicted membrane GTPase involved in stress response